MESTTKASAKPQEYTEICWTVVAAVSATLDNPPGEIEQTLHDVIDPDALETLFRGREGRNDEMNGKVGFRFAGCHVIVESSGAVLVTPVNDASTLHAGPPGEGTRGEKQG